MSRRKTKTICSKHASVRPIPQRTCLACRKIKSKREMLRIVRTPEGNVELDISGKKEGRGAYICTDRACWEKAENSKQVEHALKTNITAVELNKFIKDGIDFLKELGSG